MNEYYIIREDFDGSEYISCFEGSEEDAICRAIEISRENYYCSVEVYDIATDTVIWR